MLVHLLAGADLVYQGTIPQMTDPPEFLRWENRTFVYKGSIEQIDDVAIWLYYEVVIREGVSQWQSQQPETSSPRSSSP